MGVLDHLCQAAPSVDACLVDFARYFTLVAVRGQVTYEDDVISIAFEMDAEPFERVFVEATVGLLWARLREYVDQPDARPERVEVRARLDPRTRDAWRDTTGANVVDERPANRLVIPPGFAATPLLGDNDSLRSFLDRLAKDALPPTRDTWAGRVAQTLLTGHSDAEFPAVAKRLAVSERTLRRRLHEEGTSFSEVRQRELQRRAEAMLAERRLSQAEIAFCLGFSEMSAFNRAFRRWTGRSPGAWAEETGRA
jgi:AraC-like DNA-binding protein